MKVWVNGEIRQLPDGTNVDDLVRTTGAGPGGVAVAVNGAVVARSSWTATTLDEGDRVEVLGAMQGG